MFNDKKYKSRRRDSLKRRKIKKIKKKLKRKLKRIEKKYKKIKLSTSDTVVFKL